MTQYAGTGTTVGVAALTGGALRAGTLVLTVGGDVRRLAGAAVASDVLSDTFREATDGD